MPNAALNVRVESNRKGQLVSCMLREENQRCAVLPFPLVLLAFAGLPALATETKPKREPSPAQQAQHDKMRQCSATAKEKGLHADPRKAFMKDCLVKHATG